MYVASKKAMIEILICYIVVIEVLVNFIVLYNETADIYIDCVKIITKILLILFINLPVNCQLTVKQLWKKIYFLFPKMHNFLVLCCFSSRWHYVFCLCVRFSVCPSVSLQVNVFEQGFFYEDEVQSP